MRTGYLRGTASLISRAIFYLMEGQVLKSQEKNYHTLSVAACAMIFLFLMISTQVGFATQAVVSPRVHVLFDDPSLTPYAKRVAATAEEVLDTLIPLFGFTPRTITLRLDDATDIYNGLASALPRPNIGLTTLFPTDVALSYRAESDLRLLLTHELTHLMQFAYLEGRGNGLRFGFVGENVANVPPEWLVEGLAVWDESEFTTGGRRDDALTRDIVESTALAGTWPSLADASLLTYDSWPGTQTKYVFGVGFTDYLIHKYGYEAVKKSLAQHNATGFFRPFATSWQRAVGSNLFDEWQAWRYDTTVRAAARAERARLAKQTGKQITKSGGYTQAPALSPDGSQLAWVGWPAALMLADVDGGKLSNIRTLLDGHFSKNLKWLDTHTLLYSRPVPRPTHTYLDLFSIDTHTGWEKQITHDAHAKMPAPLPKGCILYVVDSEEHSRLMQYCPVQQSTTLRWRSAPGTHIVGLATSRRGQIALSIWRRGFVDLALLNRYGLQFLTQDSAQDLEPSWHGEGELLFRSDRESHGVFELFKVEVAAPIFLSRLTQTVGGAFSPEAGQDGIWFVALAGKGYNLAWLPETKSLVSSRPKRMQPPAASATVMPFTVRPYSPLPSLAPYGWLPTGGSINLLPFSVAAEASVLAQDDSTDHHVRVTLGFDSARSTLLGFYGFARYDYGKGGLPLREIPRPLRWSVQVSAWPLVPYLTDVRETALGFKGSVTARLPEEVVPNR